MLFQSSHICRGNPKVFYLVTTGRGGLNGCTYAAIWDPKKREPILGSNRWPIIWQKLGILFSKRALFARKWTQIDRKTFPKSSRSELYHDKFPAATVQKFLSLGKRHLWGTIVDSQIQSKSPFLLKRYKFLDCCRWNFFMKKFRSWVLWFF